jgi:hypothetical protein
LSIERLQHCKANTLNYNADDAYAKHQAPKYSGRNGAFKAMPRFSNHSHRNKNYCGAALLSRGKKGLRNPS